MSHHRRRLHFPSCYTGTKLENVPSLLYTYLYYSLKNEKKCKIYTKEKWMKRSVNGLLSALKRSNYQTSHARYGGASVFYIIGSLLCVHVLWGADNARRLEVSQLLQSVTIVFEFPRDDECVSLSRPLLPPATMSERHSQWKRLWCVVYKWTIHLLFPFLFLALKKMKKKLRVYTTCKWLK